MSSSLKEVAARAGVSIPTASLILSRKGQRYSAQTRRRVDQAACALAYRPNIAGRGLRQRKSLLLGVMLFGVNSSWFANFLRGVMKGLGGTDYSPIVFAYDDAQEEADCLRRCLDRQVDGLIVNLCVAPDGRTAARAYERVAGTGKPTVEVFGHFINGVSSVNIDYRAAGRTATEQLIRRGHRRIAMLTHEHFDAARTGKTGRFFDAWERYLGYEEAMCAAGLNPVVVTHRLRKELDAPREFVTGGAAALKRLRDLDPVPTAVICYADGQAVGLLNACQRVGIRVPGDLSLVGFGDLYGSRSTCPALTTQSFPAWEIGRSAAALALDVSGAGAVQRHVIPVEWVPRESVAAPTKRGVKRV